MIRSSAKPQVRLRVLLSAFAVSPFDGSEGGVGWETATRLASYHDVTVLCGDVAAGKPTKCGIDRYFKDHSPLPGLTICYVGPTPVAQFLEKLHCSAGLWFLYWVAYHIWQRSALVAAQELHCRKAFDVVHQLTYASYRDPGCLWRLLTPFFWGPVGGAANVPLAFGKAIGISGAWRFGLRNVGNWFQRRLAFQARRAARIAKIVWVDGDEEREIIQCWGGCAEHLPQTGTTDIVRGLRTRGAAEPLRIVWSGLHIPGKALPLLLDAIARLRNDSSVRVEILGDGPETQRSHAKASRLKLDAIVKWYGKVSKTEALSIMARAHVLVHTSLKEGTPSVVLEALSAGLPVICHDISGMALAVTAECGIKVPLRDPETSITGFAHAIASLANDTALYERLSAGALARARELTWDRKIERFSSAYLVASTSCPAIGDSCGLTKIEHTKLLV